MQIEVEPSNASGSSTVSGARRLRGGRVGTASWSCRTMPPTQRGSSRSRDCRPTAPAGQGLKAFDEPGHQAPQARLRGRVRDPLRCGARRPGDGFWFLAGADAMGPADAGARPSTPRVADMTDLYGVVAEALQVPLTLSTSRGRASSAVPRGSIAVYPLRAPLPASTSSWPTCWRGPRSLGAGASRRRLPSRYDLGSIAEVGIAITDAVALPGHGVLCAAAAEDSPNTRDDGPVMASALRPRPP